MPQPRIVLPDFPESVVRSFWSLVELPDSRQCMRWLGRSRPNGQGIIQCNGRDFSVQRFSYTLSYGVIPTGKRVRAICRKNSCTSPAHVRIWENGWVSHCPAGHPLSTGSVCSTCGAAYYRKKKTEDAESFIHLPVDVENSPGGVVPDTYVAHVVALTEPPDMRGCMRWAGPVTSEGYGYIRYGGKSIMARRISWMIRYGSIRKDKRVVTICRNRLCMNTAHMVLRS